MNLILVQQLTVGKNFAGFYICFSLRVPIIFIQNTEDTIWKFRHSYASEAFFCNALGTMACSVPLSFSIQNHSVRGPLRPRLL